MVVARAAAGRRRRGDRRPSAPLSPAVPGWPPPPSGGPTRQGTRVRAGLVGTGYWASEVHAAGVAAVDEVELSAVWGRDPAKAEELAARYGATPYTDAAEMFAAVDLVTFAVPPHVQAPLAVQAADAGCHLLLEKPVALSVEQAEAVVAAVERAGVASVVFVTARHQAPVEQWLQETVARGGWTGAVAVWVGSVFHEGNPFGRSPLAPGGGRAVGHRPARAVRARARPRPRHRGDRRRRPGRHRPPRPAPPGRRVELRGGQPHGARAGRHPPVRPVRRRRAGPRSRPTTASTPSTRTPPRSGRCSPPRRAAPRTPPTPAPARDAVRVLAEAQAQLDRARTT